MKTDVAIIGGGPAGSASAMFLVREGIRPVIIEAETFPRYHVGESMTGECGGVVRDLGLEPTMLRREFPKKTGVGVYGKAIDAWYVKVMGRDADWKLFNQFTWQVRRSEFDKLMLEDAVARGADLLHGKASRPLVDEDGAVRGVQVRMADGGVQEIESEVLLDCSGQATFLANAKVTGPKYLGSYDKQIAIFSQVAGAIRDEGSAKDDTLIFYADKYHWAWFIPLDEEVVSVGVVIPAANFLDKKESKRDFLLRELHELHPELKRRLPDLQLVEAVHVIPNYSYQVKKFCGPGYLCIGDAHRFIDPIFSFGLFVSMKEAEFAAPLVRAYLDGKKRDAADPFAEHQLKCEKGIDVAEDVIDAFWEHPLAFALFTHHRYPGLMVDMFAGRLYERQPSEALTAMRSMLKRERTYDSQDIYSLPIGSRFHPERAPIWEVNAPLENTEAWMRRS